MIWCSSFTARGSVIAYDFLRGGGEQCEELLGTAQLRPRLGSWTNLYRVENRVMPAGGIGIIGESASCL